MSKTSVIADNDAPSIPPTHTTITTATTATTVTTATTPTTATTAAKHDLTLDVTEKPQKNNDKSNSRL